MKRTYKQIKNSILFSLVLLLLIPHSSCNKAKRYNPDELLFYLNIDINLRPEAKYILILENTQSKPQSFTLSSSFTTEIKRGEDIIGGAINLHFILANEFETGELSIKSYYDVPFGKTINIKENNLKQGKAAGAIANLSFVNIPDFDIISRTAKSQDQAFTLNTLETPITTAALGGETFEAAELFYACFQKGDEASFKLERIPDQANYTVDFANLNTNMIKHTFAKNINGAEISHASIQAWTNAILSGEYVGIFNLDDFSIFPSSTFDIFTPTFERYFSFYIQDFQFDKDGQNFRNWYYSSTIYNEISLLDANLKVTTQPLQLPIIESLPDEYSIAEISFETEGFEWIILSPKTDNIYIPEFPLSVFEDISGVNNLIEIFLKLNGGKVKLIDYYPYANYDEVIGLYLGSDGYQLDAGTYYRTQEEIFSF